MLLAHAGSNITLIVTKRIKPVNISHFFKKITRGRLGKVLVITGCFMPVFSFGQRLAKEKREKQELSIRISAFIEGFTKVLLAEALV